MKEEMPWFRMYAEAVDDEKLRLLAFEDRWHFVAILCCKRKGLLDAGDATAMLHRKLSVKLGLAPRDLESMALRLAEVGLIDPDTFQPIAWDGRQFKSDGDPTAAERKRRQRERDKGVTDASRVTVTEVTRTDTDTEEESEQEQEQKKGRSAPLVLPEWLPGDAWDDWNAYRNSGKGWTAKARQLSLRTLTTLYAEGHDPRVVIELAIERGWRGLFAPRTGPPTGVRAGQDSKTLTGMKALQGMKNGLVHDRNHRRAHEADVLEPGPDARRRLGADHGGDVD